jgi:hypothetical protein
MKTTTPMAIFTGRLGHSGSRDGAILLGAPYIRTAMPPWAPRIRQAAKLGPGRGAAAQRWPESATRSPYPARDETSNPMLGASRLLELGTFQACGQSLGRPIRPLFLPRVIHWG